MILENKNLDIWISNEDNHTYTDVEVIRITDAMIPQDLYVYKSKQSEDCNIKLNFGTNVKGSRAVIMELFRLLSKSTNFVNIDNFNEYMKKDKPELLV